MTVLAWQDRDKKIPLPKLEEELKMEIWHLLKNEGESGLPPLLTFPLIIKL